jgi:RNA polymerase sigma-70 factor (ECF subfamily)
MENELKIIEACQAGNFEGFGALYEAYIRKIYDFIYYKTYHKETAEDIASAVFMKVLENIKSYKPGKGSFSAWLYGIARHAVIDHYRKGKPEVPVEDVFDLPGTGDLTVDIDAKDRLEEVRAHLAKFKPAHREIVILRLWQELSHREIAEITGTSEANCKMIFSRTLGKLRAEMGPAIFTLFVLAGSLQNTKY